MQKTLDAKLAHIAANPSCQRFHPRRCQGRRHGLRHFRAGLKRQAGGDHPRYRSLQEFRDQIREIVAQQLVDIMLMSASTSDVVAVKERLFDDSSSDAGDSGERYDRHLAGRQQCGLRPATIAAISHGGA